MNQVCKIWSKRLIVENGGTFPDVKSVELEDIKQFVANTLAGTQDDVSEADDMSEVDDVDGEDVSDEEAQSDPNDEGSETSIAEDCVEVVDPDLINDAKELKSLINTIESKEYWRRWNDLDESVSMNDDENDNALRKMSPEDKDLDYLFDIYDHAMNRAYLAVFPLYFEHYVDKDFANKAIKRSERFVSLERRRGVKGSKTQDNR